MTGNVTVLVAAFSALLEETDKSGEVRRGVVSRLWRAAETDGIGYETQTLLVQIANALEFRDVARERRQTQL